MVVNEDPSLVEILWNFSRFKDERRLTLKQNPHFYAHLPMLAEEYTGGFTMEPTEDFHHVDKFYVLTDRQGLAYFKTDQHTQCFGNFWCPNDAIIFKGKRGSYLFFFLFLVSDILSDLGGRLMGDTIIRAAFRTKHWQFCTRPLVSAAPVLSTVANRRICPPSIALECPCENWKRQIDGIPGSDDINLIVCSGRAATDDPVRLSRAQRQHLLLTLPQLLTPLPPTSEQPRYSVAYKAHIYLLNDDALLNIFHHCRLEDIDGWNLRLTWCKLAHVCRRWRYLIYDLSSLLDMFILIRNGSPILDSLAHLPPLPLIIDYCNMATTQIPQDELSILPGLQQRGRVRRIFLQAPSPRLGVFLASMGGLYPILEDLFLLSATEEEAIMVLPSTFCAPNIRHLATHGIGLPSGLSLSTSTTALVTLTLTRIHAPNYLHPEHLVTQLQGLLYLEELSIGFAVPIPLPSTEMELLPAPRLRVTLPILKRLMFRGVAVYLENLIAQINAPLLERLIVTLYFELAFTLVALTQFILATGGLRRLSAKVIFKRGGVCIVTSNGESLSSGGLVVNINCERLDWQIDAATECCGALENVLTAVEELTLNLDKNGTPSDWDDPLDSILWRGLLLQFSSVKKLLIGSSLAFELSAALESDAAELHSDLLPELRELEVQLEINDEILGYFSFIKTRELEGRPVELVFLHFESQEHDMPISEIRSPPGLQTFLMAPSFDALHSTAERGPVIVIGLSAWRSDIIILLRGSPPSIIPTAHNFYSRAKHMSDRLLNARRRHGIDAVEYEEALSSILESLYDLVGRSVIQRLHDLNIPEQSRIWFCPTSVFYSLPLHAMGPIRSEGSLKLYLSDLYIPSYTPTLSALIEPPKLRAQPLSQPTMLLVIKHSETMPGILQEVEVVQSIVGLTTQTLIGKEATPSSLLKYLKSHQFVHISCDESSKTENPLTFFKLYEGTHLALLDIVRSGLPTAEFAFLPGCHMAEITNKSTADEELHLAGIIQYCGFRSVVGTMWDMADKDGPVVAENFYSSMFSTSRWQKVPYYERTAEALRDAVKVLRSERGMTLERWVNFVHYGA